MKCTLISPDGQDDFQDITSIYLVTTSGEWELLEGHIALIAILQEGPSIRFRIGNRIVRVAVTPESFFQFASDTAEVISTHYSTEWSTVG